MNNQRFVPGFGDRLKEERHRLGLSQHQLAELAGIQRLAQAQYENGKYTPRYPYFGVIDAAGMDLHYLFYGVRDTPQTLPQAEMSSIERNVFDFIEVFATTKCGGVLSGEARHALFDVLRNYYINGVIAGRSSKEILAEFGLKAMEKIADTSAEAILPTKDSSSTS